MSTIVTLSESLRQDGSSLPATRFHQIAHMWSWFETFGKARNFFLFCSVWSRKTRTKVKFLESKNFSFAFRVIWKNTTKVKFLESKNFTFFFAFSVWYGPNIWWVSSRVTNDLCSSFLFLDYATNNNNYLTCIACTQIHAVYLSTWKAW